MKVKHQIAAIFIVLIFFFPNALADIAAIRGLQGNVRQYEENGRVGLMDADFNVLHKAVFSHMGPFDQNGMASIWAGNRMGKIDRAGNIRLHPQPYVLLRFEVIDNATGDGIYVFIEPKSQSVGLMDMDGKILCEPTFEAIGRFENGTAFVKKGKGQYNIMDVKGNLMSDKWFTDVDFGFRKGTIEYESGKDVYNGSGQLIRRYGLDKDGKKLIREAYTGTGELIPIHNVEDMIDYTRAGIYWVKRDGHWGGMDLKGEEIIPCEYERTLYAVDAGFIVVKDGRRGMLDRQGNVIINTEWDILYPFDEDCCYVQKDGKCGLLLNNGTPILEPEWDELIWWQDIGEKEPSLLVQKGNQTARYIDRSGNTLKELDYAVELVDINGPSHSDTAYALYYIYNKKHVLQKWAIAERNSEGQYRALTYIDGRKLSFSSADQASAYQYIDSKGFLATIRRGKENGFIKPTGEVITSPDWECVYPFNNYGTAFIRTKSEKYRLIDLNGAYLNGSEWDNALFGFSGENGFEDMGGYAVAKVGLRDAQGEMRFGYINHLGELIDRIE